jgi:galactokinase
VIVEIAASIGNKGGIYGCRMTGGGFGGCCVALVRAVEIKSIAKQIEVAYKIKTGIAATVFSSRPAAGATIIKG